ncbi:MAG: DUF2505 domain-containing protein [Nocardioides sp.]|uniref:DUF2505 domain-containing protein n=1 Tax=Nocardioides sp. TaxID=35761 RepID=UPI0039E62E13
MSKQLRVEHTYDAPIERVAAMLADPGFREQVYGAQRARDIRVEVTGDTTAGATVAVVYTQPVAGVPGFAKKLVGDAIKVHQDETWTAGFASGRIEISLPGKPGSLAGTATLAEHGSSTVETIELTASVSIPLVGGKAEELICSMFAKALRREQQVGVRWLEGA